MGTILLKSGGVLSFAVAFLHLVIIFIGAPGYRYFGAGEEMAQMAESGSLIPAAITFGVAVVFALCGLYAFSGAGVIRRLPLRIIALLVIGAIYTLRGISAVPQIILKLNTPEAIPTRFVIFSLVALIIGLLYLGGTIKNRKSLRAHSYF
jgi:hypothetical protein